jgi:hypothetical protein
MSKKNEPVSTQSLHQVLLQKSIASPYVLYPTVAAVLGAVAGTLFGFSGIIAGVAVSGAIAAVGGFTTEFAFRRDRNMKRIVSEITKQMEERRQTLVSDLQREIANLKLASAEKQLNDFQIKFTTFVDVLDDRFSPTELTFMRYMNVAEQVYLSGMDNLRNAVISHKALTASDIKELRTRMSQIGTTSEKDKERDILVERIHGYEATTNQIAELMLKNERALTMLDQVTQKLARTQVEKGMADSDTESAISELGRLGAMLSQYAK